MRPDISNFAGRVVVAPCWVLHRLWWLPIWNRSALLTCPIAWACRRSERFAAWFWHACGEEDR